MDKITHRMHLKVLDIPAYQIINIGIGFPDCSKDRGIVVMDDEPGFFDGLRARVPNHGRVKALSKRS